MDPRASRNLRVWQFLIASASNRRLPTYGEIGKATGLFPAGMGAHLDVLADWCRERRTPSLTVIVVSGTTGIPSALPDGVDDVGMERERVFNYPWFQETPPHPDEL